MAITEKLLEQAREMMTAAPNKVRYSVEDCLRAYVEYGTLQKAADALGCNYQTVQRKVAKALAGKG